MRELDFKNESIRHGKLRKLPNCFPKRLYHFTFLPVMCVSSTCSMSAVHMFCRTQDPLSMQYTLYTAVRINKLYMVTELMSGRVRIWTQKSEPWALALNYYLYPCIPCYHLHILECQLFILQSYEWSLIFFFSSTSETTDFKSLRRDWVRSPGISFWAKESEQMLNSYNTNIST